MAVNRAELIACLNELVETCRDGEKGFRTAASGTRSPDLKSLFEQYAEERAHFASELRKEVRHLGGDATEGGTISGAFHRGWMDIKSAVARNSDDAIVSECEKGEDAALRNYERVQKQNLPTHILPMVKHQYLRIKEAHSHLHTLEKAA